MAKKNCKNALLVVQQKRPRCKSIMLLKKIITRTIAKKSCNDTHLILQAIQRKHPSQSRKSYRAMLAYIARAGGRINSTNSRGETALHLAVKRDDIEAASQLVRLGADVNRKNLRDETPLQVAVVNWSHADVLAEIIPNGKGLFYTRMADFYGLEILDFAIAGRDHDAIDAASHRLVKMLIDAGADVNTRDINGFSPLQCAIYTGNLELVTMLIDAGADVNNRNMTGASPLHDAVFCCNDAVVSLLLSHGANVATVIDLYFLYDTALHWASILNIGNSHDGIIIKLLEFGSDVNKENGLGLTPFHYILEASDINFIKLCIDQHKADLNQMASDGSGNTLAFAVRNMNENVMDLVLESGIEIDQKSRIGRSPLHSAAENAMLENVRRLISLGADVNAKDAHGLTPLAFCILGPSERDGLSEHSALTLYRANFEEERRRVIRLLLECGNDVNQMVFTKNEPQDQWSIFELMIRDEMDFEAMGIMIEHVAEVEARSNKPLLNDYNLKVLDEVSEDEPEIKSYYQTCQAELMAMKTAKIEGTTISYFSVLTEPLDVVTRYARNEDFVKAFKTGNYQTAYNSFASKLEEKFNAAIARQKTMEQASSILSATLQFADSSQPVFEIILKYLSEADVKILISST